MGELSYSFEMAGKQQVCRMYREGSVIFEAYINNKTVHTFLDQIRRLAGNDDDIVLGEVRALVSAFAQANNVPLDDALQNLCMGPDWKRKITGKV